MVLKTLVWKVLGDVHSFKEFQDFNFFMHCMGELHCIRKCPEGSASFSTITFWLLSFMQLQNVSSFNTVLSNLILRGKWTWTQILIFFFSALWFLKKVLNTFYTSQPFSEHFDTNMTFYRTQKSWVSAERPKQDLATQKSLNWVGAKTNDPNKTQKSVGFDIVVFFCVK